MIAVAKPLARNAQRDYRMRSPTANKAKRVSAIVSGVWRLAAIAALSLVALVAALHWSVERLNESRATALRTASIESDLQALGEDLLNAETGQRGYLLTQNSDYLNPYLAGVAKVQERIATLNRLGVDPRMAADLAEIGHLTAAKLDELAETIRLNQAGQREQALHIVNAGSGKNLMDQIRAVRSRMLQVESQDRLERRVAINARASTIVLIGYAGSLLAIGILLVFAMRTARRLAGPIRDLLAGIQSYHLGALDHEIPVVYDDEVGHIASAFNRMAQRLQAALAAVEARSRELSVTNAELASSQSRLQTVVENIPALVSYADREQRYGFVNSRFCESLNLAPADILGRTIREVRGEASYLELAPLIESVMAGQTVRMERKIELPRGIRWMDVTLVPEFAADRTVVGSYGFSYDVTERRQAEQALRTRERFLARIGDVAGAAAGVGGWEFDVQSGALNWSDQVCRLLDREPGYRASLQEALDYCVPAYRPLVEQAIGACIAQGLPFNLELELISARGRSFWVQATGFAESVDGKTVRLFGALQDVSELRQTAQRLAESHERMRVTLESIGDAVITTDQNGIVDWLNAVAENMTGWSKEEASGKPVGEVFRIVDAETRQAADNPVARCLEQGKVVGLANHTVLIARHGVEHGIEDSAAPIRNATGHVYGVVLVFHDVTEHRRLASEMSYRASHDPLTNLVNRAEFDLHLSRLLKRGRADDGMHVLLYIDLDEFKVVNDSCGHAAGDELLKSVSVFLTSAVRSHDTVARLGGDEFGVILERCSAEQGQVIAQKICDHMEIYRFAHGGHRYRIGTSIGVVPVDSRWANSAAIMQAADTACYAAKEGGRNRVHLWGDSDGAVQTRHGDMRWVNRLEAAMDENTFLLYGQRIESIGAGSGGQQDGKPGGLHCEVLLRLREPDGSIIMPAAFLPAAERFHLASRIDRWVLHHVFELLESSRVADDHIEMFAVNLSGQSIGDRAFHRDAVRMIREAAFDVRVLCFEITETAAITNLADARLFIEEVRSLGVKVALDDFGAGASSFGYLRSLPVDFLKIDGQFVAGLLEDPLDDAAARCFCEVAKVLGLRTIAECVERADTREALMRLGVDMAQGYLIHRPESISHLISGRTAADAVLRGQAH